MIQIKRLQSFSFSFSQGTMSPAILQLVSVIQYLRPIYKTVNVALGRTYIYTYFFIFEVFARHSPPGSQLQVKA